MQERIKLESFPVFAMDAALIAVGIISAARILGTTISATFKNVSDEMSK